jgi:hypothetical protein
MEHGVRIMKELRLHGARLYYEFDHSAAGRSHSGVYMVSTISAMEYLIEYIFSNLPPMGRFRCISFDDVPVDRSSGYRGGAKWSRMGVKRMLIGRRPEAHKYDFDIAISDSSRDEVVMTCDEKARNRFEEYVIRKKACHDDESVLAPIRVWVDRSLDRESGKNKLFFCWSSGVSRTK